MMKKIKNKFINKGFALMLSLGILAVLFIIVFTVAGLAGNSIVQTSLFLNKKQISVEYEAFANQIFATLKTGKTPILELRSKVDLDILMRADLKNAAPDNIIFTSKKLQYKDGDSILSIRTSFREEQLYIDSTYLINPQRTKIVLISEKNATIFRKGNTQ